MFFILLLIGLLGSSTIALIGYYFKQISFNGMFATVIIGTSIAVSGSFPTWSVIVFLFGSSLFINFIKRIFLPDTLLLEDQLHEKKGPRDPLQILANTLPSTIALVLYALSNNPSFLIAYLASIASATSDTWGSEIGMISKGATLDLMTFKPIPKGISGGVSLLGTFASLLGSLFSILCFYFFSLFHSLTLTTNNLLLIVILGFTGSLIDSFIGSLFQGTYKTSENQLTEQKKNNTLAHGFSWLSNDLVNLITNSLIALIAFWLSK